MDIRQRMHEIRQRKLELSQRAENTSNIEELRSINDELTKLNIEIEGLEIKRSTPQGQLNVLSTYGVGRATQQQNNRAAEQTEQWEQRAAQFENGKPVAFNMDEAQIRAITVAGGNVPLSSPAAQTIQPYFNEVSNIVDIVHTVPLQGGESYKQPFVISSGSADYTTESGDYHLNDDIETGYVEIAKAKITTYFELPEEVQKLGGSQYLTFAQQAALTAVRKKLAQQIIVGAGGTNSLVGIFNAPVEVVPETCDMTVATIDAKTLDDIVFGYGGDESVEGGAYLILNKKTLAEFSKIRSTTGERLYTITLDKNGNSGTISSEDSFQVPFIINSIIKGYADAAAGEYFAVYGKPISYEMPLFSGLEIQESRDYKFRSGQVAIRASVFAGGNVCCYKGFTRIKKG